MDLAKTENYSEISRIINALGSLKKKKKKALSSDEACSSAEQSSFWGGKLLATGVIQAEALKDTVDEASERTIENCKLFEDRSMSPSVLELVSPSAWHIARTQ